MGKKPKPVAKQTILKSQNQAPSHKVNEISEETVLEQLDRAPEPGDTGRSGYPHQYQDLQGLIPRRVDTTSTAYYEYPVSQSGVPYNFQSKPKDNPGPYRAISNQDKDYRATICHDGDKDKDLPNKGFFHLCQRK